MDENIEKEINDEFPEELPTMKDMTPRYFRTVLIFLAIIAFVLGGYEWVTKYSPAAKEANAEQAKYADYQREKEVLETAMRDDAYGGKTPQETLALFIDALKKGDIDLASKYFELPEANQQKWRNGLEKTEKEKGLSSTIEVLIKMQPSKHATASSGTVDYVVTGVDGVADYGATLVFNQYAGVWKIESF